MLRTRRNHALEHATIHLLSARLPNTPMVGRSDSRGFYLYGNVPTEALESAVHHALDRLRRGEHQLAIHPNCGTNLLTSALFAGTVAFFSLMGIGQSRWRDRLSRLPIAILGTTMALIVAQPVGTAAQKYLTTQGDPGSMEISRIRRIRSGPTGLHRVLTQG
ncbi:MAG: DUF6391 domain-containing protein [Anaerolineales bacterium]